MVVTISYRDKPDEILYSFSKVGDSVCIGRDKRQCKIALGINAQGLLVRDISTYGTGYDGGPFVIEREKELKPFVVLQIGSFFFIIEEKNVKQECIEETIANPFLRIAEINSRKRLASNKAIVVVEEECVAKKRKVVDTIVEKLATVMNLSEREVAKSTKMQGKLVAHTDSGLSTDRTWIQEQDRKLVAKMGKEVKERMNSVKLAYYRRITDFLPSDDEDSEENRQNKSKVPMFAMVDSSRNIGTAARVSLRYNSGNKRICNVVQDTYFPTADISFLSKKMAHSSTSEEADELFKVHKSMKIMPKYPTNLSIFAEAKGHETLDDIDTKKLSKPLFNSAQLTSFQRKLTRSINEVSTIGKSNTSIFHTGQFNLLELQSVGGKFCDLLSKTVLKERHPMSPKVISGQETIVTGSTSWIDMNTTKKRSNQFDNCEKRNQSDADEMLVASKRVKIELVVDGNKRQESEKNESPIENRTECEVNVDENDRTLGTNIEVLRMKLRKAVQYENLTRPILAKDRSQFYLTGYYQGTNYKHFRKAAQGSHGGCGLLHSVMTRIVGIADLIDFREIA
uniref:FHA domain-containing protein n=1 Tax=Loa loa TaxID=7209 RepID=A0A1I7VKW2_LOALO